MSIILLYVFLFCHFPQFGQTPLFFACKNGHVEIVEMLLQQGADVNVCDVVCNLCIQICTVSLDYLCKVLGV